MRMFPPRAARSRASAFALALGALGLLAALAATARADPKILAKVDGAAITEDDYNDALADIGPGLPEKLEGPEREKYVLDYLIDLRLVAKQALADKLDGTADFARRLAYYHDKLAMEGLLTNVAKSATTEEAERKAYDEAAKAQPPEPEVHARHILLTAPDAKINAHSRVRAVGQIHIIALIVRHHLKRQFVVVPEKQAPLALVRNGGSLGNDVGNRQPIFLA